MKSRRMYAFVGQKPERGKGVSMSPRHRSARVDAARPAGGFGHRGRCVSASRWHSRRCGLPAARHGIGAGARCPSRHCQRSFFNQPHPLAPRRNSDGSARGRCHSVDQVRPPFRSGFPSGSPGSRRYWHWPVVVLLSSKKLCA